MLPRLRARRIHTSAEMIARRIVNLRDAICSVWDQGKLKRCAVAAGASASLACGRCSHRAGAGWSSSL